MKYLTFFIVITLLNISSYAQTDNSDCSNLLKLLGTEWQCKIADGCINVYEFKNDSNYKFYSCEMIDTFYGSYFFKQDTLILDEKGSVYDTPGGDHNMGRKKYYCIIKNGKLRHLKVYDWFNDKFELSNFKFDDSYFYKRVK